MSISGDPKVTLANLQPLLNRLGVRGLATFDLIPHVVPVAIVDGQVSAVAVSSPPLDVPFTAGELTAPAANTRLADTGPLTAGQYNLTVMITTGTDQAQIRIRRRNAADGADIWEHRFQSALAGFPGLFQLRVVLASGERVVIENVGVGNAGIVYQGSIWVQGPF